MMKKQFKLLFMGLVAVSGSHAKDINVAGVEVKPSLEITSGVFYSQQTYHHPMQIKDVSWQEIYAKYGFDAEYALENSMLYGGLKGVSSATFGDGDAAYLTTGNEHRSSLEEWVIGWKNAKSEDATLNVSLGRQNVQIADGFMVAGDALNLGQGAADGSLDRGGAYYLAARRSFDLAAVVDYQLHPQLNSHWYYLESDNKAQSEPTLFATDWRYQATKNSHLGLTYLKVLDLNDPYSSPQREGLHNVAIRAQTQLMPDLQFSAQYVHQEQKDQNAYAWYSTLQYQFQDVRYQPTLGYRYSHFSEHYDPLFYGNTEAGFGTWFQGEVAGNYAGPYSTNTGIHQISLQASVKENLHLGVLAYHFNTLEKSPQLHLDANEIDVFAIWSPTPQVNLIPLIGVYNPEKDHRDGGAQMKNDDSNLYTQLIFQYLY